MRAVLLLAALAAAVGSVGAISLDPYLITNAEKKGVVVLPSGLQYKVLEAGDPAGARCGEARRAAPRRQPPPRHGRRRHRRFHQRNTTPPHATRPPNRPSEFEPSSRPSPKASQPCSCHYEGKLTDGSVFDSSYKRGRPTTFAPNQVTRRE